MKNVYNGLGVKSMSDLILKETYGSYGTNEQIKRYKMTEREHFEKYCNLSKSELKSDFCKKSLQRRKRETKEV